jgi:hypothetical protein
MRELKERVLPDDHPVYWDYLYVADGKVIKSDIQGDVRRLKLALGVSEIKNCDIYGRQDQANDK